MIDDDGDDNIPLHKLSHNLFSLSTCILLHFM